MQKLVPLAPIDLNQSGGPCAEGQQPCGPCCCPPPSREFPGYRLEPFVSGFKDVAGRTVPRLATILSRADRLGTLQVRCGFGRNSYRVAPGLYCVGDPGPDSPVLVTANYKLTVDALRRELSSLAAWVLVVDTRGINVWCAAGKSTFSAAEVVRRVREAGLQDLVSHRRLILPQLAAPGVTARDVKRGSGFEVVFGPVRARDLQTFIRNGLQATPAMRAVDFPLADRLVLAPVEVGGGLRHLPAVTAALLILAVASPDVRTYTDILLKTLAGLSAFGTGLIAGAVLTPALLPWLPGRAFALKGAIAGAAAGLLMAATAWGGWSPAAVLAGILGTAASASWFAMQFTGATPYTSPSGVELEMRRAIPLQGLALLASAVLWVIGGV